MQIIIPMSGSGERFKRAGYQLPKPLIEVEGKPIIAHVIDLFPGEKDFLFICDAEQLAGRVLVEQREGRRIAGGGLAQQLLKQ